MRTFVEILSAELFPVDGIRCHNRNFRFASRLVSVKGERINRYAPREIISKKVTPLRVVARQDLKRATLIPQEKENRLPWLKERPKRPGEIILAWFGPIIEDALVKLALNKQRGTLLIWYNPHSRRFNPRGLYLYRRLGLKEKPGWQWADWR